VKRLRKVALWDLARRARNRPVRGGRRRREGDGRRRTPGRPASPDLHRHPSFNQGPFVEWTVRASSPGLPGLEYVVMTAVPPTTRWRGWSPTGTGSNTSSRCATGPGRRSRPWLRADDRRDHGLSHSDDVLAPGASSSSPRSSKETRSSTSSTPIDAGSTPADGDRILGPPSPPRLPDASLGPDPQETCFWRRRLFERAGPIDRTSISRSTTISS